MGLLDGVYCLGVSKEWSLRNFGHITSVFRCMTVGGLVCDCSWCRCVMLCIVYCGCSVMPYGHCGLCGRVLRGVSWRQLQGTESHRDGNSEELGGTHQRTMHTQHHNKHTV